MMKADTQYTLSRSVDGTFSITIDAVPGRPESPALLLFPLEGILYRDPVNAVSLPGLTQALLAWDEGAGDPPADIVLITEKPYRPRGSGITPYGMAESARLRTYTAEISFAPMPHVVELFNREIRGPDSYALAALCPP